MLAVQGGPALAPRLSAGQRHPLFWREPSEPLHDAGRHDTAAEYSNDPRQPQA
jgi:hypothetical protein